MSYKLLRNTSAVLRLIDNVSVLPDENNRDWQEYQRWLSDGNTPEPTDPEPPPTEETVATVSARDWYAANPGAKQLFQWTIPELEVEITTLVNSLFPNASNADKTRLVKLLTALGVDDRVIVRRLRLME